jgi:hypothetical protein
LGELVELLEQKEARSSSVSPYPEKYSVGTFVRIAPSERLRKFMRPEWKYHHPVSEEQLQAAGKRDKVRSVGFYHGGDVLYQLSTEIGTWHEDCLDSD